MSTAPHNSTGYFAGFVNYRYCETVIHFIDQNGSPLCGRHSRNSREGQFIRKSSGWDDEFDVCKICQKIVEKKRTKP